MTEEQEIEEIEQYIQPFLYTYVLNTDAEREQIREVVKERRHIMARNIYNAGYRNVKADNYYNKVKTEIIEKFVKELRYKLLKAPYNGDLQAFRVYNDCIDKLLEEYNRR